MNKKDVYKQIEGQKENDKVVEEVEELREVIREKNPQR